jgi:hypothetical protein
MFRRRSRTDRQSVKVERLSRPGLRLCRHCRDRQRHRESGCDHGSWGGTHVG